MARRRSRGTAGFDDVLVTGGLPAGMEIEPPWKEEPGLLQNDERELDDLGFMFEDPDDLRTSLLEHWLHLEGLDSDEAVEAYLGDLPTAEAALLRSRRARREW
jgi:hypothetical protein